MKHFKFLIFMFLINILLILLAKIITPMDDYTIGLILNIMVLLPISYIYLKSRLSFYKKYKTFLKSRGKRMARRQNDLFIGSEHLNIEGRAIKHPALIKMYASVNLNKIQDNPIRLIGCDLETNHKTGELKLLGFWDGKDYHYYTDNFLSVLYRKVKYANKQGMSLAYWNRLDPFVLYKQFLLIMQNEDQQIDSLSNFGKRGGEWNQKTHSWDVPPISEIFIEHEDRYFGIMNVIHSSIQFFIRRKDTGFCDTIWAFDIAQLYENGLETEAKERLKYYSKVDKSAHLVDWQRFDADADYRDNIVLKSNKLDAMAVYDLGRIIQMDFHTAFKYYPKTLISHGAFARSATVADIFNTIKTKHPNETEENQKKMLNDEIKSIAFVNYLDEWITKYPQDMIKDLYCMSIEAYSAGYIESIRYGYAKEGWTVDLASAYPAIIRTLYDLRGAKITNGTGEPPHIPNSYCFIRGDIDMPMNVQYHPITVKHPINNSTNIRAVGQYRASYIIEERDYCLSLGAKFSNETWINIETTGKLSPLAHVVQDFLDLRAELKEKGDSAQYMAKIAANSLYGILFEAVDTYEQSVRLHEEKTTHYHPFKSVLKSYLKKINIQGIKAPLKAELQDEYKKIIGRWASTNGKGTPVDVVAKELEEKGLYMSDINDFDILKRIDEIYTYKEVEEQTFPEVIVSRAGYRAGEFFNPIFATYITAKTRIKISEACNAIQSNGGKPIVIMTDSILWQGNETDLPSEYWREKKTVGYFEKPQHVKDIVCLGAGRYGYETDKGYVSAKRRGLNAEEFHNPKGAVITDMDWLKIMEMMRDYNTDELKVKVRTLVSVGMMFTTKKIIDEDTEKEIEIKLGIEDLGRVIKEYREIDLMVGKSKRLFKERLDNVNELSKRLVETEPLYLTWGMFGDNQLNDQTLPKLREMMMAMELIPQTEKDKKNICKATKNYKTRNKKEISSDKKSKYDFIKSQGYSSKEATKMSFWSLEKIQEKLMEDGKL